MKSHRRLISPENPVNFLKIILCDDTGSTGLRLPVKFTDEYGKFLSEKVTLKVPNGDVWQVELYKSGDEVWLKNGWGEFAEHYGLKFSNMLVFKYEGCSTFGVIMFNATASEIEYPESKDRFKTPVKPNARKFPVSSDEPETTVSDDDSSYSDESETIVSKDDTSSWLSEDQEHGIKIKDEGECSSKAREIEKGKADFKSDKPFMVYINQSHLTNRGVYLPAEFRRKFSRGHKSDHECSLQLKNDGKLKAWKVVVGRYLGKADWLTFVEDNGVKVGDVLVIEMIHNDKDVLCVSICRSGC
ncbi:putative transcription factor B3-Domain family [Helianthus annuus]|uniref:Transcription factor B3-Domain family n=1 Tax=Helianthus annuus TaxID=4232 RepID=A0A9K3EC20_HELAN|nr:B3 domain-containing protein At1g49475 [Helianthus annuus]XP_022005328.1 B3 domain-containing protein At1g49475 [Helianthus annuus]XP_022005330.1 B3 domain-containing protein At1g49475 [Helianthus annuus]KAF5769731.1 putative transcription factor B3-Domain family [Helianthus annuus]KAJ0464699.1 putative transcription factor B3-Domain family [Helianthus annuus]KAJ0469348.1 putative transcription factor B3-Domain family [Helianthus annuus]KAJ0486297.1 putative transcription factor B3-Domain 